MVKRVIVASPGGWNLPSARYRLGPLARAGPWPIQAISVSSFPLAEHMASLLDAGGTGAVLILQRVMPSPEGLSKLRTRYEHVLLDFDDAIYSVPPDLMRSRLAKVPRQAARLILRGSPSASARKRPLERSLRHVDACVVGNEILGGFARRHSARVFEIPTTVEPVSEHPRCRPDPAAVVWLGLPDNLQYLELVKRPLERLKSEVDFRLRIVSSIRWNRSPIPADFIAWSPLAAREALLSSSVGLAPLTDDPWTRGKCAFRSIQYGGHALPTVASPVGITDRVVLHGTTGYLARTETDWFEALRALLTDRHLANRMGVAALDHVHANFSNAVALRKWVELLTCL